MKLYERYSKAAIKNIPEQYISYCTDKNLLGEGAEGSVFSLGDKVIKVFKLGKDFHKHSSERNIISTIELSLQNKNVVKIYNYGRLTKNEYFYVAKRLNKLSAIEAKIVEELQYRPINEVLFDLSDKLIIRYSKLFKFYMEVASNRQIIFADLRDDNIMKDDNGNYYITDIGYAKPNPLFSN